MSEGAFKVWLTIVLALAALFAVVVVMSVASARRQDKQPEPDEPTTMVIKPLNQGRAYADTPTPYIGPCGSTSDYGMIKCMVEDGWIVDVSVCSSSGWRQITEGRARLEARAIFCSKPGVVWEFK